MAYQFSLLSNINPFDEDSRFDSIADDGRAAFQIDIEASRFDANQISSVPTFNFNPFSNEAVLPEGYSYVGDEIMFNLYGEDSAWFMYDPDNFVTGNVSSFIAIPGLTAPMSNLFNSTITVSTGGDPNLDQFVQQVMDLTQAALDHIAQYIDAAAGASLDVAVTLAQQGPSTVASAGAGALFFNGQNVNGFDEVVTGSQIEFITGNDPNGTDADIVITVNTDFLTSAQAFLETGPNRMPGFNQIDYVSVLAHEIMHGLGFFSFRDNTGNASNPNNPPNIESSYGTNVNFAVEGPGTLVPRYSGENVVSVYGEDVLLEYLFNSAGSDVSHYAQFDTDGTITDLAFALLNPSVVLGDVTTLGAIDLAVLRDLGYDIQNDANLELVNPRDGLPNNIVIDADADFTTIASETGVLINRSIINNGQGIVSVGVEAELANGTTDSARVRLAESEMTGLFALSDDLLTDLGELGGGDIDFRLFYTANASLVSGQIEETFSFTFETQSATNVDDIINGTAGSDRLVGAGGDDQLRTLDGDDIALGGTGNDFIVLGLGDDHGYGGSGNDTLRGEAGADRLFGNDGLDLLRGGDGEDELFGGADRDFIFGEADNDFISGGDGNDRIFGDDGDDFILGDAGNDSIDGGDGLDIILGGTENDVLRGNAGEDLLFGEDGNDAIFGGEDNDQVFGDNGDDAALGGLGDDILVGGEGEDRLFGEGGVDTLEGESGADRLFGGDGNDILNGGSEDDLLSGGNDNDTLNGGDGVDFLNGGAGLDELHGGDGDDTLVGRADNDMLFGEVGDDRLFGDGGHDILDGGAGLDRLNGGTGADTFVFSAGNEIDIIQDFQDGIDMIDASSYTQSDIQTAIDNAFIASNFLVLDFGNGDQLRIADAVIGDITLDDFGL